MNILKKLRVALALLFVISISLLFFDFTGTIYAWIGWVAKIQLIPALLALNIGTVVVLVLLTLLFGRVYCSVICPLGVFQDMISAINKTKNKYKYSSAHNILRYIVLALFIVALVAGIGSLVALLEPYSAYGRMASNLFAPFYKWGNNILAYFAERADSYAFYQVEVSIAGLLTFVIAISSFIIVSILAWRNGRIYCNAICPVGTVLGLVSKVSIYKHRFDANKCNSCGLCAKNCKASCINPKLHTIDYSRCVSCFNCIDQCNKKAISYVPKKQKQTKNTSTEEPNNLARRNMLTVAGLLLGAVAAKAKEQKVDGGLAFIEDKKVPERENSIVPPGSKSIRHFKQHCTACQLCVSACPNQVLRPSAKLDSLMQPELSFERGYCRPECVKCSEVCPTKAIAPITTADKSATQIGHAVWIEKNCVVLTDGVKCGNCERHCPVGAITMISREKDNNQDIKVPMVDTERCIGCGACENLCPARPFSAIYVEGHIVHRTV